MQHYELMFIVDPAAEEVFDDIKQKIEGIITGREGVVVSFEKLGKKRLAYPVAKRLYGTYFLVNLKGNGRIVSALDYFLRLNTSVLRHIVLAFTEKELKLRERTEAVLAEEAERMRLGGRPSAVVKVDEIAALEEVETGAGQTGEETGEPASELSAGEELVVAEVTGNNGEINPVASDDVMDDSNSKITE